MLTFDSFQQNNTTASGGQTEHQPNGDTKRETQA